MHFDPENLRSLLMQEGKLVARGAKVLYENEIDGTVFSEMTEDEFKKLGLSFGVTKSLMIFRQKLIDAGRAEFDFRGIGEKYPRADSVISSPMRAASERKFRQEIRPSKVIFHSAESMHAFWPPPPVKASYHRETRLQERTRQLCIKLRAQRMRGKHPSYTRRPYALERFRPVFESHRVPRGDLIAKESYWTPQRRHGMPERCYSVAESAPPDHFPTVDRSLLWETQVEGRPSAHMSASVPSEQESSVRSWREQDISESVVVEPTPGKMRRDWDTASEPDHDKSLYMTPGRSTVDCASIMEDNGASIMDDNEDVKKSSEGEESDVVQTETAPIYINPKTLEFVNCPTQTPVNENGESQLMIALPEGKGLWLYFTQNQCEKLKELESLCECTCAIRQMSGGPIIKIESMIKTRVWKCSYEILSILKNIDSPVENQSSLPKKNPNAASSENWTQTISPTMRIVQKNGSWRFQRYPKNIVGDPAEMTPYKYIVKILVPKDIGETCFNQLNRTKWADVSKIRSEENAWVKMEPSYLEVNFTFRMLVKAKQRPNLQRAVVKILKLLVQISKAQE